MFYLFFFFFTSLHGLDHITVGIITQSLCNAASLRLTDFTGLRRYICCMTSLGLKMNTSEIVYSWNEHHLVNDN